MEFLGVGGKGPESLGEFCPLQLSAELNPLLEAAPALLPSRM